MCNDSVIVGLNGGMGKTSREQLEGGKERLFMVPYFLSQHPLSSRGKSIPKVEGHSGGIPLVQPCVCVCVSIYALPFLSSLKHLVSLIFFSS